MRLTQAAGIPGSRIREIAALADQNPGTLRLFYGEDTLPTPEFIKAAAHRAIDQNHTYYTPNAGYGELRKTIAEAYSRLHEVDVSPAEVVVTASGMVSIVLACQATVGPGDSAVLITPLWPNLSAAVRAAGAEAVEFPLEYAAGGFELDYDKLEAAIKPNTRLLALASPGNPTGWTASEADWKRISDLCNRRDLWLLADGVYERLYYEQNVAPSPWELAEARPRTIVAQSFSKAYRMTGWRIGYTIALPELSKTLAKIQEFVVSHAAGFTQEAARFAILEGDPFIAESLERYRRHRRIAVDRLRAMEGVSLSEPSGAFYVFPKLEGLKDSFGLCKNLVEKRKVGVAPGSAFGVGGEGHIRICFAVDEKTLSEGMDRFEAGWMEYRQSLEKRT